MNASLCVKPSAPLCGHVRKYHNKLSPEFQVFELSWELNISIDSSTSSEIRVIKCSIFDANLDFPS
eukprot:TRINITY_DN921_c0_g1_i4.p2 TRINITY_DN921_c0_g1~~TRINITY_DN921_c0_g1_i4.p2  ORF type:complete len:66 (+),score=13.36 TRINITY_DN921_c0_g1_i4:418-615(+)